MNYMMSPRRGESTNRRTQMRVRALDLEAVQQRIAHHRMNPSAIPWSYTITDRDTKTVHDIVGSPCNVPGCYCDYYIKKSYPEVKNGR